MQELSAKERLVIYALYTLDHTEESLGERLYVSRRRVRNLKNEALVKLRKKIVPRMNEECLFIG